MKNLKVPWVQNWIKNKTKIYGIGNWQNREQWPIEGFQTDQDYFHTLGIFHSNNYHLSVEQNWNVILDKIKKHTNILLDRKLSLHQRVVYANTRSWLYGGQNSNFEVVHLGAPSFFYKSLMEKGNKNENAKKIKFRNCRPFFIKSAFYP